MKIDHLDVFVLDQQAGGEERPEKSGSGGRVNISVISQESVKTRWKRSEESFKFRNNYYYYQARPSEEKTVAISSNYKTPRVKVGKP